MKKVVHLIPYDGVGGVESAARTMADGKYGEITFQKVYIASNQGGVNSLKNFISAFRAVLSCSPDLLVASLWRSVAIALACKIFRPRMKMVVFLHSNRSAHIFDWAVNRVGTMLASEVWADSEATISSRFRYYFGRRTRIISFLLEYIPRFHRDSVGARFIFWGRLNKQKAVDRAIRLFSEVATMAHGAEFLIIGPDNGEREMLEDLVASLGLDNVQIMGAMERSRIMEIAKRYNFFLQTSIREGMCIAVVEAMQNGLVPIVTPVGEIANYCRNGVNSIFLDSEFSVSELMGLVDNYDNYLSLSTSASQTWNDKELYANDFLATCELVLD